MGYDFEPLCDCLTPINLSVRSECYLYFGFVNPLLVCSIDTKISGQFGSTTEVDNMRFKDTMKQKYKHEEYPQVRKTGVDAVHESCPQRSNM